MDLCNVFQHLICIILGIECVRDTMPKKAVGLHEYTYFSSNFFELLLHVCGH